MNRTSERSACAAAALAGAVCLCVLAGPPASAQVRSGPMDASFDVLSRKSIFSRDGLRPATQQTPRGSGNPGRVLSPEQSVAFRGVLLIDEEFVAFVENIVNQQMMVIRMGDKLATGHAGEITLDTLQFIDAQNRLRDIRLGQDLTGQLAASSGGGYSSGGGSGGDSTAAGTGTDAASSGTSSTPPADASQAALIERMRARKRAEEGR